MKNLKIDDVKKVAERLMINFNQTTTLEIKMELRSIGFKANQLEVSQFMMELSDENGWIWNNKIDPTTNSVYRIYTLPDGYSIDSVATCVANINNQSTGNINVPNFCTCNTRKSYVNTNALVIEDKDEGDVDEHDWVVTSPNSDAIFYFDKKYTRDNVRQAYSKFTGIHFHDTRTMILQ